MDYEFYMRKCLEVAAEAEEGDDVPVGCVIVDNGEIIGTGCNRRNAEKNAVMHAEIIAISEACQKQGDWRLETATLFVTIEPCPMCAGAIVQARIKEVVYAAPNKKAGCCGSVLNLLNEPGFNHQCAVVPGVLESDAAALMSDYFKRMRRAKKF